MKRLLSAADGQGLIEFAMVLPIFLLLVLGVIEVSYALLNQHVVTKLTREGSNLISRDTTLQDAATAMRHMTTRPVDFSGSNSRMILSVIRREKVFFLLTTSSIRPAIYYYKALPFRINRH